MEERIPLLPSSSARSRDAGGLGRSKLAAMIGGLALVAALALVVAVHRGQGSASLLGSGMDGSGESGRFPGYMGMIQGKGIVMGKGQVLYQDWRGMSLEQRDSFYFSHTWNGELNVGHTDNQHIVKPSKLEIEAPAATSSPGKQKASEITAGGTLTGPPAPRAGTQGPGGALPPSLGKPAVPAAAAAAAAASPVVCTDASKLFKVGRLQSCTFALFPLSPPLPLIPLILLHLHLVVILLLLLLAHWRSNLVSSTRHATARHSSMCFEFVCTLCSRRVLFLLECP
jgi:hypothetical protein